MPPQALTILALLALTCSAFRLNLDPDGQDWSAESAAFSNSCNRSILTFSL